MLDKILFRERIISLFKGVDPDISITEHEFKKPYYGLPEYLITFNKEIPFYVHGTSISVGFDKEIYIEGDIVLHEEVYNNLKDQIEREFSELGVKIVEVHKHKYFGLTSVHIHIEWKGSIKDAEEVLKLLRWY
jgi:hypothetical protein